MTNEYAQEKADLVCELIMDGYSLRKIEAETGIKRLWILKWLRENADFQTQYAHAREEQADVLADEILEISDNATDDIIFLLADEESGEGAKAAIKHSAIQRARLQVDSRKWIAGKLKPKKYGDSTQVKLADANGGKLSITWEK